jgi:hypothetical protein
MSTPAVSFFHFQDRPRFSASFSFKMGVKSILLVAAVTTVVQAQQSAYAQCKFKILFSGYESV